jgi:putative ATP-dependent endonuclease of OLD family
LGDSTGEGGDMYVSTLEIENFRCFGAGANRFRMSLGPGLTALVGENDAGKTAVIDALRFGLGTVDQEWLRLEDADFCGGKPSCEIKVVCKFEGLTPAERSAFVEYLTYGDSAGDDPALYVNWTAKDTGQTPRGRPYRRTDVRSGKDGSGPVIDPAVRRFLSATYLRPLRNAEEALSAGRGSRLAQILLHSQAAEHGCPDCDPEVPVGEQDLSLLGISKLLDHLLARHKGIGGTREQVDEHLESLSLHGERLTARIQATGATATEEARLRELLEKLDLSLDQEGRPGFGSNNLLFMACELLLLTEEEQQSAPPQNRMLLIEEPEAHLHPQRQLRVMKYLQEQAEDRGIQVIVTTHSPNLASAIDLNNLVMISDRRAFPMAEGKTDLDPSDYRFLQRFLDVTKANLFFARGVMIVEGDAENVLLPTLAQILGRDFAENGVSVVNVGGLGLHRYARVFRRQDEATDGRIRVPVACLTDMDVMPDCAPVCIGKVEEGQEWPPLPKRSWRAKKDIGDDHDLVAHRGWKMNKAYGQRVRTFVSDEWTFEYDLALGPRGSNGAFAASLAEDVFVASCLAKRDDRINTGHIDRAAVESAALEEFGRLAESAQPKDGCAREEVLCSLVYADFAKGNASKAIAAQYLAERLKRKWSQGELTPADLEGRLPEYIVDAIRYVTDTADTFASTREAAHE